MVLMIALWPERFCRKSPSGHFHCLMLSGEAEAKVYSFGFRTTLRIDFLWFVSTTLERAIAKSQSRTVESMLRAEEKKKEEEKRRKKKKKKKKEKKRKEKKERKKEKELI